MYRILQIFVLATMAFALYTWGSKILARPWWHPPLEHTLELVFIMGALVTVLLLITRERDRFYR